MNRRQARGAGGDDAASLLPDGSMRQLSRSASASPSRRRLLLAMVCVLSACAVVLLLIPELGRLADERAAALIIANAAPAIEPEEPSSRAALSQLVAKSDSYVDIFSYRGHKYNEASELAPMARNEERALLLQMADLRSNLLVLDAPAGGGYVQDALLGSGLYPLLRVINVEPSKEFASAIRRYPNTVVINPLSVASIPEIANNSIDRVLSLAGLHHLTAKQKQQFFFEAHRVLRPGGLIVVADVMQGSPPADFLNDAVDRLTYTGHKGEFFARGELASRLHRAQFNSIFENYKSFCWNFANLTMMSDFTGKLFGLEKAHGDLQLIETELRKYFTPLRVKKRLPPYPPAPLQSVSEEAASDALLTCLPWGLLYASAQKPIPKNTSASSLTSSTDHNGGLTLDRARYLANRNASSPLDWMSRRFEGLTFDIRSWGVSTTYSTWYDAATDLGLWPNQVKNPVDLLISSQPGSWHERLPESVYFMHFIGSQEYWSNKAGLWLALEARLGGSDPSIVRELMRYSPRSYLIPTGSSEGTRERERLVNQTASLLLDMSGASEPRLFPRQPRIDLSATGRPGKWVIKPGFSLADPQNMYKHRGSHGAAHVALIDSGTDLMQQLALAYNSTSKSFDYPYHVVQKYIERPMLWDGYKFDIRAYMLVTSVDPPVVYLYEDDFIVRLAQHLWHQDLSTQSKTSHITNIQFTRTVTSEDEPDRVYSLEHIREYFRSIEQESTWSDVTIPGICALFHSLIPVIFDPKMQRERSFALLGVDLMLDTEGNPWLLELNTTPNMNQLGPQSTFKLNLCKDALYAVLSNASNCTSKPDGIRTCDPPPRLGGFVRCAP